MQPAATEPELDRGQLLKCVRAGLGSLHDPAALRANGLCKLLGLDYDNLRTVLLTAVEALRPEAQVAQTANAWRRFRLLELRYLEGHDHREVERLLALSKSQYYREHEAAVDAVAIELWRVIQTRHTPARAADVARRTLTNLPARLTSFIGRARELSSVRDLLQTHRWVTLTGAGGSGKTRLALETAATVVDRFEDGVWIVDLTPLAEASLVGHTIASTLGISEAPGEPIGRTLSRGIGERQMLLVLDNCEHLIRACAQAVQALLESCPRLQVLMTSRELAGVIGESVFQVPPLPVFGNSGDTIDSEAVALFLDRARAVQPEFRVNSDNANAVADICIQLDGLPLALELAAARLRVLTPAQIAQRLQRSFGLFAATTPIRRPHHQTLKTLVDWSHDLLLEPEKILFRRLAVFAGDWSIEAAEAICADDDVQPGEVLSVLAGLVDKSMLVSEPTPHGMRYRMLETLRQYALQRLVEAGEDQDIQLRHACHYADLVLRCKARLFGPEQIEAVKRIESEHNNIRAVLSYGARSPTAARLAGQVAGSVGFFWFLRNHFSEGRHWLDWVLSLESVNGTADAVWCLGADGVLTASMGDGWEGIALCDRAVSESQATSDPLAVAWAYSCRSGTHFILGNAAAAEEDGRIGMVRSAEAQWKCGQAICSAWLGRSLLMQGRLDEAAEKLHVSLDLARASGDAFSNGLAMSFYGAALGARGQYGRAAECLAGAQELFGALGCLAQQSRVLVDRATLSLHAGNVQDAASALRDALDMATELGKVPYRFAQLFTVAAHIALAQERYSDALKLVATARDLRAHSATQVSAEVIAEETALIASIDGGVGESAPHLLENIQPMSQAAAVALAYELAESI